ncbi:MAG: DUF4127 family protein [Clostridia bacterium]|nr:DUF4127 family protein [Clostridia bacterium]MCI2000871.1 DUF4127 family protein [Clostridia bacterium]MCI2015337.1 DUF4127 family protein [Clostridia bacterium]
MNVKKLIKILIFVSFAVMFSQTAFAYTVITSPIDSRPISNSYFQKLTKIHNDTFYTVDSSSLDMFTGSPDDHFADSAAVRKQICKYVERNNNSDTAVILNMSSYITGGLIGSRCGKSYSNTDESVKELFSLISEYNKPKYYIILAMPRNLPETRGQKIWPDNKKIKGLGAFYVKYNGKNKYIEDNYSYVTPSQFLMEYSYVCNKKEELGENALSKWEKDYIDFAYKNYVRNKEYAPYIEQYITPFEKTAQLGETLIRWQRVGRIGEIIFGNDDLQLPDFISYALSSLDSSWIQTENGSPIKYSFSRTYMTSGKESIQNYLIRTYSDSECRLALEGKSKNINFIFGMDELPQLTYARFLAQKTGKCADFNIIYKTKSLSAGYYDVFTPSNLLNNALNFVSSGNTQKTSPISVYVCDYGSNPNFDEICKMIYNDKNKTSLIELYTNDTLSGKNEVFKTLLQNSVSNRKNKGICDLSSFSAWNTNANAIGLGIAHSQVYMLSLSDCKDTENLAESQEEVLIQHAIDDGLYYGNGRHVLQNESYTPSLSEMNNSEKLKTVTEFDTVKKAFINKRICINGDLYYISDVADVKLSFPWKRLFDCDADVKVSIKKIKILS